MPPHELEDLLKRTSLKVSPDGIDKVKKLIRDRFLGEKQFSNELSLPHQIVLDFVNGRPVEAKTFLQICEQLKLDCQKLVDDIDEIVEDARQKVFSYIEERFGKMRVLDMEQPIGLTAIYTSVNILKKITGRRRVGIAELLQKCNLEEFDRFGLDVTKEKRLPGLDAVKRHSKIIVLGKPGAGKTTFLKYLAIQCNRGHFQTDRVPVSITLKDFAEAKNCPDLFEYVSQQLLDRTYAEQQNGAAETGH